MNVIALCFQNDGKKLHLIKQIEDGLFIFKCKVQLHINDKYRGLRAVFLAKKLEKRGDGLGAAQPMGHGHTLLVVHQCALAGACPKSQGMVVAYSELNHFHQYIHRCVTCRCTLHYYSLLHFKLWSST